MKSKLVYLSLTFIFLATIGCNKSDDNSPQNQNPQQVKDVAQNGNWKISYFYDSDREETNHFTDYSFSFNDDGSLVAGKGSTTVTGTWSVTNGNSSDDDGGSSNTDFNIFFAAPDDFVDLSEDWDIVSVSDNKIALTHVSGGNGGTDLLTFEKL